MSFSRFARRIVAALALSAGTGCAFAAAYDDRDLDSGLHPVRSVLLSQSHPAPGAAERDRPVAIVAHGFSATSWEVQPLVSALMARGMRVSSVTLGGHGTSLEDFRKSDWQAWRAPMLAEYRALRAMGYRNISLVGHSTGATLWLRSIADGSLGPVPDRMVFLAPLIEFAPKTRGIYFAGALPWVGVEGVGRPLNGDSKGHWYKVRPITALQSLTEVISDVRRRLVRGLALPARCQVLVVQGDQDDVVDPVATQLVVTGIVGPRPRLLAVKSWMHNPVGPDGIQGHRFTPDEAALRERLLTAIGDHLVKP